MSYKQKALCVLSFRKTRRIVRIRFHLEMRSFYSLSAGESLSGLFLAKEACPVEGAKVWVLASWTREEKQMLLLVCIGKLTEKIKLFYSAE